MPILLLLGCGKLLTVELDGTSTTAVDGGNLLQDLVGDLGFDEFARMDITEAEELANQGVEPGDLESVQLVAFDLEIVEGDPDLSFIDTLSVWVESPDLPPAELARQDAFPAGQSQVALELLGVDLVDYAVSQSMTLTTEVSASSPDEDSVIEARYVLRVEATLRDAARQAGR